MADRPYFTEDGHHIMTGLVIETRISRLALDQLIEAINLKVHIDDFHPETDIIQRFAVQFLQAHCNPKSLMLFVDDLKNEQDTEQMEGFCDRWLSAAKKETK